LVIFFFAHACSYHSYAISRSWCNNRRKISQRMAARI
jgi:hypothetical protein